MMAGNLGRQLLGLATFLIIARFLGPARFGEFASIVAIVGILGAFSGWGSEQLLVRRVVRSQKEFPQAFCSGLVFLGLSAPCLIVAAMGIIPRILGSSVPPKLIFLVAIADIFFARLNTLSGACYQAVDDAHGTARANVSFSGLRFGAAVVWVSAWPAHGEMSWAWCYLASSGVAGISSIWKVSRRVGRPTWHVKWMEWKDGFLFALQIASMSAFRDIDKPMVASLASLSAAGHYSAGLRIADGLAMPIRALMYATFPDFFRQGISGAGRSLEFAFKVLPFVICLGLGSGLALVAFSPLAPLILGNVYADAGPILLTLSGLPLLYGLCYLGGDILISSGYIWVRTSLQVGMPVINVLLCIALVPEHGAVGAAVAALLTNLVLACASWLSVAFIVRRTSVRRT